MSLPALPATADTRSITERVNVLIREYNQQLRVPPGMVLPFAGAAAPDGFLLCDGSAVSRTTCGDLFAAIGTAYGAGDGSTTFNVPDLRGRVAAGRDDMGGAAASRLTGGGSGIAGATLGAVGGAETHALTTAEMPGHAHPGAAGFNFLMANAGTPFATPGAATAGIGFTATTGISGSGQAHNNAQPTIVLNYVIAT